MPVFYDGKILFTDDGAIAMTENCCCQATTTAIPCTDDNPSMVLTVTADDANLPVTWCGKTWVKSTATPGTDEAYSGQPQQVCPTSYNKDTPPSGAHEWIHAEAGTTTTDLTVKRQYTAAGGLNGVYINPAAYYAHLSGFFGSYYFAVPSTWRPSLGAIPTPSDFYITDAFYTSITISGVTYTWSKGVRW